MRAHERHLCDECLGEEFEEFRHACVHESMAKNEEWTKKFGVGSWPRWDYQMYDATLIFSSEGVAKVVCEMQVVGTSHGDSWEWSWGNPNLPTACKWRLDYIREFGEEKRWEKLTKLFLPNDEFLGWECCAIASHLLNAVGVYRAPNSDQDGAVWMVVLNCNFVA